MNEPQTASQKFQISAIESRQNEFEQNTSYHESFQQPAEHDNAKEDNSDREFKTSEIIRLNTEIEDIPTEIDSTIISVELNSGEKISGSLEVMEASIEKGFFEKELEIGQFDDGEVPDETVGYENITDGDVIQLTEGDIEIIEAAIIPVRTERDEYDNNADKLNELGAQLNAIESEIFSENKEEVQDA